MKKRVGDITDVYDYLCEYVHPNHGSNTLVARGEIGRGELEPDASHLANVLDRMCGYCVCAIKAVQELELEGAITCMLVSDLSKRAVKRGATVRNVFAKRPAKPEGDGKSKETAFHFPRARTPQEAIGMIYEYLESEGIEVPRQEIGAVEGGFIYDVFPTRAGRIWFKIPKV